jgi:hypothetical protein
MKMELQDPEATVSVVKVSEEAYASTRISPKLAADPSISPYVLRRSKVSGQVGVTETYDRVGFTDLPGPSISEAKPEIPEVENLIVFVSYFDITGILTENEFGECAFESWTTTKVGENFNIRPAEQEAPAKK